jgi:FkbM family methyltransferase
MFKKNLDFINRIYKKFNHYNFYLRSKKTAALIREIMNNKKLISIIDIGAGNRYLKTLLNFDGSAEVTMVDPNKNLEWAIRNLKSNLKYPENVKGFKCGIGDKTGKKNYFLALTSTGSTFVNIYNNKKKIDENYFGPKNMIKANIYSLKDFIRSFNVKDPDIIKIDVEGFEKKIILSVLKYFRPLIIEVELNNNHPLYGDSFSIIHSKLTHSNYELVTFVPNYGAVNKPCITGNKENPIYRSTVNQMDCIYVNKKITDSAKKLSIFIGYGLIDNAEIVFKKIKNKIPKLEKKISIFLEQLTKKS